MPGAGFGGQIPARIFRTFMERALPILAFSNERNAGARVHDTRFLANVLAIIFKAGF